MPHSNRRAALALTLLATAAGLTGFSAHAQAWPSKPVTLTVGSAAGSAPDIYARVIAEQLQRQTGGVFVVDNKPGANGNLAAETVLRTAADGHTLLIGTQSQMTINPSAYSNLRWKASDFRPLVKGVESPMVLVTHPTVGAKNFAELKSWIARHKGQAQYASFSPGTPSHFLGYQLNERLQADMVHIPYKGSSPQVTDLMAGQVPLGFTQMAVAVPQIQAGKLVPIAVTGAQRASALAQVPTLAELGLGDLTASVWFGVFAPAGVPRPVSDAILSALRKAHSEAAVRAKLEAQSFEVPDESGAAFEKNLAAETAKWARVVKATGFRAND
ncbi:Bug family tripartite tricarboxylate transporter substrate binding protein [Hydrogenophaga sp. BPS33]|uniref:Bug family tripartite tricarboxylate transporter substrate binding protein n=1 Tax=Hydrogenophaga sp. BPS33 TaxID=2651974 RepID=UPI00135B0E5A|nr:tripartite tricarboxylate transporter substrate binding protein [Hydrogenophaga sp. BPS33]